LTGSVTYQFGGTSTDVRTNSPLIDHNAIGSFSEELRLSSNGKVSTVGGRRILRAPESGVRTGSADTGLRCDHSAPARPGLSSADQGAPADTPFFSDLHYNFKQSALFGEATYRFTPISGR